MKKFLIFLFILNCHPGHHKPDKHQYECKYQKTYVDANDNREMGIVIKVRKHKELHDFKEKIHENGYESEDYLQYKLLENCKRVARQNYEEELKAYHDSYRSFWDILYIVFLVACCVTTVASFITGIAMILDDYANHTWGDAVPYFIWPLSLTYVIITKILDIVNIDLEKKLKTWGKEREQRQTDEEKIKRKEKMDKLSFFEEYPQIIDWEENDKIDHPEHGKCIYIGGDTNKTIFIRADKANSEIINVPFSNKIKNMALRKDQSRIIERIKNSEFTGLLKTMKELRSQDLERKRDKDEV